MSIALPQRGDRTWQQQQLQYRPRLPPVRRNWGPCGARRQCSCDGCRVRNRCFTAISWRNSGTVIRPASINDEEMHLLPHAQAHQDPRAADPVVPDARGQWLVLIGDSGETSADDIESFFADIWPDVEPEAAIQ